MLGRPVQPEKPDLYVGDVDRCTNSPSGGRLELATPDLRFLNRFGAELLDFPFVERTLPRHFS